MSVKWESKKNKFPDMQASIKNMKNKTIKTGCFGEHAWLAGIHEYGCVITPGSGRYLTIPCNPKAKGRRAREFSDLFFLESESGVKFLARLKGKDGFEIMYTLVTKVIIPERAFLRNGHDENIKAVLKQAGKLTCDVLHGKMKEVDCMKTIGIKMSSAIKDSARDLSSPQNHWTTIETKRSSNPLVDTGDMIGSITYKIE